jgi:hypothetical protein
MPLFAGFDQSFPTRDEVSETSWLINESYKGHVCSPVTILYVFTYIYLNSLSFFIICILYNFQKNVFDSQKRKKRKKSIKERKSSPLSIRLKTSSKKRNKRKLKKEENKIIHFEETNNIESLKLDTKEKFNSKILTCDYCTYNQFIYTTNITLVKIYNLCRGKWFKSVQKQVKSYFYCHH